MHKSPTGIKMMVQHKMPPRTNITNETGNPINNHKQAVISAPVNLKPIHNKNIANNTVINKLIIFFTPLTFFPKLPILQIFVFPLD